MMRTVRVVWTWLGIVGCPHPRHAGTLGVREAWRLAVGKHTDPPPWNRR
jgi:hypothetical protein